MMHLRRMVRPALASLFILAFAAAALVVNGLDRPAFAQEAPATGSASDDAVQPAGQVPGGALGDLSDSDFWRQIRGGIQGTVSIPDKKAGVLVQSSGEGWRAARNGPLSEYGGWLLLAVIVVLAVFFAFRGRIRIESGRSVERVTRFTGAGRFAHWLTAVSFIVLAFTGLNLLYGRYLLKPLLGPELFSSVTAAGKYAHNHLAFAFMAGLLLMFVLWVGQNIPNRADLVWLAKGGGLFTRHTHPPARKFNAGQKILFWLVILGGVSVSLSGIALLFPFELSMFSGTFKALNLLGLNLPTDLTPQEEMQLSQLWHAVVGLLLIAVIIGHIYIGTLGMEGAFEAMSSGQVDRNWAEEHHSLWMAELESGSSADKHARSQPAE